jgi:LysM repeat protein
MTSPNLTEIGAGVAVSNGRVYYVIDCAHPSTDGDSEVATSVTGSRLTAPAREAPIAVPIVSTPNSNGDVIHEVQVGQTLWQLAIAYNVKIDEIKGLNNLFDNSIYPGTKLLIKTGVIQPTVAQTETPAGDLTVTPINALISTATIIQPTLTSTKAVAPLPLSPPANTSTTMGVVIGIIVLALLGGGLFIWLGSSKK